MYRNEAQTQTDQRGQTGVAVVMLAIALLAWGAGPSLNAEEASINVDLVALTGNAEYAALTAGVQDAPFAVAMRIDATEDALRPNQWASGVEAGLDEAFASFEALHMASETLFTAFFTSEEELAAIAEVIGPAFEGTSETSVSVRTDPNAGRQLHVD